MALAPAEAAQAIGVSRRYFYDHVLPELRVVRRGRKRIVPTNELERWLTENAHQVFG
jgi:excisionase family DNA binding protein